MEFMLSPNMPNIIISYEEVDDFDGFPSISEESKEKCRKFQNFMQKFENFRKQISNEDTMEESEEISQEEFLIPKENLLYGTRIPKPSGSEDNEDTMEEMSQEESEPSGSEDFHEDNAVEMEEIKYEIIENSSKQKGNTMITDSCGFSYSFWRNTNKGSTQEYRCIKRHRKGKKDCKSILKVKNRGEENQKFIRNKDHNHEPDKKLNIKRQMKMDLKKKSIEKRSECPKKVIENVLDSNVQYQNLYDKGFSPKITSMTMTIKRYRKKMSSVNVE